MTETTIERPRAEVAAFATRAENAPRWYANTRSVEWRSEPPLRIGSRIAFVAEFLGKRLAFTYEVAEFVPDERLMMRTAQGPFAMETTCAWAASATGGTRMALRNRGQHAQGESERPGASEESP